MSAPDTNVERQTRKHKPALLGMAAAAVIAVIAAIVALNWQGVPADEQAGSGPEAVEATQ